MPQAKNLRDLMRIRAHNRDFPNLSMETWEVPSTAGMAETMKTGKEARCAATAGLLIGQWSERAAGQKDCRIEEEGIYLGS